MMSGGLVICGRWSVVKKIGGQRLCGRWSVPMKVVSAYEGTRPRGMLYNVADVAMKASGL